MFKKKCLQESKICELYRILSFFFEDKYCDMHEWC